MIRPTLPADIPFLVELTRATGVFLPHEIVALEEVLTDYFAANQALGHCCVTKEDTGDMLGYAYYAPAAMTDRSWYLYWIGVDPKNQSKGLGAELLTYVEQDIRRQNGRVLFVETSSLPRYDKTRRFYQKLRYELTGQLRDFYADGDDMVVFRKKLIG